MSEIKINPISSIEHLQNDLEHREDFEQELSQDQKSENELTEQEQSDLRKKHLNEIRAQESAKRKMLWDKLNKR